MGSGGAYLAQRSSPNEIAALFGLKYGLKGCLQETTKIHALVHACGMPIVKVRRMTDAARKT